jgi:hypothetical protein
MPKREEIIILDSNSTKGSGLLLCMTTDIPANYHTISSLVFKTWEENKKKTIY